MGLALARFLSMKRYTGSSSGCVFSRQSMTRNRARRSSGGPLWKCGCFWSRGCRTSQRQGQRPQKRCGTPVCEPGHITNLRHELRRPNPPHRAMAITTGYSGAGRPGAHSRLSCSRDLETAFSASMACRIMVLVRASLGEAWRSGLSPPCGSQWHGSG